MIKKIATILVLTIIASGAGAFQGLQLVSLVSPGIGAQAGKIELHESIPNFSTYELKPIVTNLAGGSNWVHLEAAAIVDRTTKIDEKQLNELQNDVIVYLRSLTPAQLEGPNGLRRLREELNERLALRSDNKVKQLLIQAMVVQ